MSKTEFDLLFFVATLTVINTFMLLVFVWLNYRTERISIKLYETLADWLGELEEKLDKHNK